MKTIGFLHTADVHVATFRALVGELAPGWRDTHVVDPSLLADARAGIPVGERVRARLGELAEADVIVCTCSTIGPEAERAGAVRGDRPMARAAVAAARGDGSAARGEGSAARGEGSAARGDGSAARPIAAARGDKSAARPGIVPGGRIAVAYAVGSTLEPTTALLRDEDPSADLVLVPCLEAWPFFEAGDLGRYHETIAERLRDVDAEVIVLAQPSMAPAAELLPGRLVLSSPRAAVLAATQPVRG